MSQQPSPPQQPMGSRAERRAAAARERRANKKPKPLASAPGASAVDPSAALLGLLGQGKHEQAEQQARAMLEGQPEWALGWALLGLALLHRRAEDDAEAALERALALDADLALAWNGLGMVHHRAGRYVRARECLHRALTLSPEDAAALNNLGSVHFELGNDRLAALCFQRAVTLDESLTDARRNLGLVAQRLGEPEMALGHYQAVQERLADDPATALSLATLLGEQGRFAEAEAQARRAATPGSPVEAEALGVLMRLRRMTPADEAVRARGEALCAGKLAPRAASVLHHGLGKLYDDLGDYARAFAHFQRGNELTRNLAPPYEPSAAAREVDAWLTAASPEVIATAARAMAAPVELAEAEAPRPVFVIGMPRSGTTLVEQILAAHPQVAGVGEQDFWAMAYRERQADWLRGEFRPEWLRALAAEYAALLARRAGAATCVVDKMPGNFAFVGLIRAAMPGARFIHVRRHPLDTCLSVYFQRFVAGHGYGCDLDHLAHYYRLYQRYMAHWRRLMPADRLLEVSYEDIVEEPERWTRRMLEFLGLPWDAACREFHRQERVVGTASSWQVRQPLYKTSVARWRHYQPWLGPLRALLDQPELEPAEAGASLETGPLRAGAESVAAGGEAASQAEALLHQAVALAEAGERARAIDTLRASLRLDPNNHQSWRNLGAMLKGTAPPAERIDCYRRALAITDDPYTRANLAAALMDGGECAAAISEARAALAALPRYVPAWLNLAHGLEQLGAHAQAEQAYREALSIDPEDADVLHGLGALLAAMQRYEEGAEVMARADTLRPADHKIGVVAARARQQIADWSRFDADVANLAHWADEGRVGIPPFNLLSLPGVSVAARLANAKVHAQAEFAPFFAAARPVSAVGRRGRVRVGYLSADLRTHVIGRLMGPVLQQSAGRGHEVYVYDLWSGVNPLRASLQPHVAAWREVGRLSVAEIAAAIAADSIDVLVDMSGYTGYGRSAVLALRPAPVQVNLLGYPGSFGDRRLVDYLISDPITSPPEHAEHYAEALAWLPGCVLPPLAFEADLPVLTRAELGLPEGALVLAALHNGYKYNPVIFARWLRILDALPEAVLWLLAPSEPMRARLRAAARSGSCDPDRLVFYTGGAYGEYLAALRLADLALDAWPYGAGGTARDLLWSGVPLVTVAGESFAGRMAASACHEAGLGGCVAADLDAYVALAVALGQDARRRAALVARLRQARAEAPERLRQYAQALDALYLRLAERARAGEAPAPLLVRSESLNATQDAQAMHQRTFLHVGCGPNRQGQTTHGFNRSEWREIRLDIDPAVSPDVVGTMTDMRAVADGSVDALFSSHNIEHLYPFEVEVALKEFLRVLKPEGFAVITCPDLQAVGALVAEGKLLEPAYQSPAGPIAPLDMLYGHRPALAAGNLYMAHKCGFTEGVLVKALQQAGFVSIASRRRPEAFDLWAVAGKQTLAGEALRALALEHMPGGGGAESRPRATTSPQDLPRTIATLSALFQQGRFAEAAQGARALTQTHPQQAFGWNLLGNCLGRLGRFDEAVSLLERAAELAPTEPETFNSLGKCQLELAAPEAALRAFERVLEIDANHADGYHNLGLARAALGEFEAAIEHFRRALELQPDWPVALNNLGCAYMDLMMFSAAESCFSRVLALQPDYAQAHTNLLELLERANRLDALAEALERAQTAVGEHPFFALTRARLLIRQREFAAARALLEAMPTPTSPKAAVRRAQLLGEACDRLGDTAGAWASWVEGKSAALQLPAARQADAGRFVARVETLQGMLRGEARLSLVDDPADGFSDGRDDPVFLVGFPRSGTTLLDTILMSHPRMAVIEEGPMLDEVRAALAREPGGDPHGLHGLDATARGRLRQVYFATAERALDQPLPDAGLLVDKMPLNLVEAPLIQAIFPRARFLFALRHPCDCVLSCFMQQFNPNDAMANFLDIEQAALLYDRVMHLWMDAISALDLSVHEVRYESLIVEFEATIAGVLAYLGLEWDDKVRDFATTASQRGWIPTPSYSGVTEGLYTRASGRWTRYRSQLKPVLPMLAPWVERFGYGAMVIRQQL